MFVNDDVILEVSFHAAQPRLANLVHEGALHGASHAAYEIGFATTIRVGPLGEVPGVSRLVRVSFLDPVYRADAMTVGLRWEAAGRTGGLFPALDANISLAPEGERTRLGLAGAYRPPLGRFGAGLDRAILNRVAVATIRSLLRSIANSLISSEAVAGIRVINGQQSPLPDPAPAGPWPELPRPVSPAA
jgi:hypothetical protein